VLTGAARQFSEIRSNGPLRCHPISTMESIANMAPFFRHNDPASPPAAHKPTALCPRLPLRPLPSTRLARPSLLPFVPPLPAPGRPAESLAWRCVAGALLGFGNKNTRVNLSISISATEIILAPDAMERTCTCPTPPHQPPGTPTVSQDRILSLMSKKVC
jgi:hypothetical protein